MPIPGKINERPPFDWRVTATKYLRAALFAGLLLAVYDQALIDHLQSATPEAYRSVVMLLLASALPAIRNVLKAKFGITFGGLL